MPVETLHPHPLASSGQGRLFWASREWRQRCGVSPFSVGARCGTRSRHAVWRFLECRLFPMECPTSAIGSSPRGNLGECGYAGWCSPSQKLYFHLPRKCLIPELPKFATPAAHNELFLGNDSASSAQGKHSWGAGCFQAKSQGAAEEESSGGRTCYTWPRHRPSSNALTGEVDRPSASDVR